MTSDWSVPAWVGVVAAVVLLALLVAVFVVLRSGSRASRRAATAESATAELRARLDDLERRTRTPSRSPEQREYVITSLGEDLRASEPVPALPAPAFADVVFRETVVHAAAFAHGVRRALSPEVRNRVRFEMKRELRRSRKARKEETREALREYRARHRADPSPDSVPGSARGSARKSASGAAGRRAEGEVA